MTEKGIQEKDLVGIGVGAPGPVDDEGTLGEFSVGELLTLFPDPVQIPWRRA